LLSAAPPLSERCDAAAIDVAGSAKKRARRCVGLAAVGTSAVSWALSLCGGANLVALEGDRFVAAYTTMWQVQAGIAAVALPVLLFVIELSKDERQAATRSHEVLFIIM
jgi:hypothetical protein